jgi:hypothetical protein
VATGRKAARADAREKPREQKVEVWDDADWGPALNALEGWRDRTYTGESDPKPLAKLLCSGKRVPEQVAWRLGVLLDPPWGKKGQILALEINKRYSGQTELNSVKEMIGLKMKIETALKRTEKLESAIAEVMKETGKSRSHIMKARTFSVRKGIPSLAKYNPQKSPRETGES